MDRQQHPRTRVIKACDRCRAKKTKCNGGHACNRCKSDNTLCTYSREAKERQPSTSPSYVLTLETHIKLLARGVQGLYQLLQRGESLPGRPLHIDKAEQPLLHDILDRLGVLEVAHQHSTFRWDPAVVDRLIYPWEASQQSSLPLRSSAPDSSLSVWPSDLSNQLNHNSYHGAYDLETTSLNNFYPALNTAFDPALNTAFSSALGTTFNTALNPALGPTLNPTLDPTLNPALHTASSTNMYVEQEMKQSDWAIGLHLG